MTDVKDLGPETVNYIYHEILVRNGRGEIDNSKFFEGPLPKVGQAVEMFYIGDSEEGAMRFQLRTKS